MNKKGRFGLVIILFIVLYFSAVGIFFYLENQATEYKYVGKIIDMEGGTSSSVLILELDTIGKTPYTTQRKCSNKIRIGQTVYSKEGLFGKNRYLWVKYAEGKYC